MNCHLTSGDKTAVYKRGDFVQSAKGHDVDEIFVVLEYLRHSRQVLVSDGRLRKMSKPKLKNVKHVRRLELHTDILERVPTYAIDANIRREIKRIKADMDFCG